MSEMPQWAVGKGKPGRPAKYPFRTMELHSVFKVAPSDLPPTGYHTFKIMMSTRGKQMGRKFVSRQLEDGTVEVCRVV